MSDTPSSILLLRLQSTGSNTNLWGAYLVVSLQTLEQASKGYQPLAVTGDATISWSNYATGNSFQYAKVKLTGTLSSTATLTLPAYPNELSIWNATGASVTIKCFGGTGVTIPNNRKTRLYCDGIDYISSAPTWTNDSTTLTNGGDLVSYTQMQAAITALIGATTAGLVLNSATATTASYLTSILKTDALSGLSITKTNGGTATEYSAQAIDANNLTASTNVAAGDAFIIYDATAGATRKQARTNALGKYGLVLQADQTTGFVATVGSLWPCDTTSAGWTITWPAAPVRGDVFGIVQFGNNALTHSINAVNWYGTSTGPAASSGGGASFFYYSGATFGWVDL